jgi:hypothetical protein
MNYYPEKMVHWYKFHDEDNYDWDYQLDRARSQVECKLEKWWSLAKFRHDKYSDYYEKTVEETIWYHLERTYIYENGLV